MMKYKLSIIYMALIVAVNVGFVATPMVALPGGALWPPMSLVVGFVFVARDFAQREAGHRVLLFMLAGAVLSYLMASPLVAAASTAAFLVGEGVDWGVYTVTKRPFSERILYSSLLGAPLDSIVFLAALGHLSASGVVAMTLSKFFGAVAVWWIVRKREAVKPLADYPLPR
ncbi:MAG TPA: hypothetical protein ENI55_00725 [Alphaproteobacteria bacterium]|nr:hypothetical protein [Alphaproteobacteria bacterium]